MAAPAFVSMGAKAAGIGDVVPAIPTHQANDILLLLVEAELGNSIATPDGGWAHVTGSPQAASGSGLAVFWLRAADGTTTDPTVADPGDHCIAAVGVFRGCETSGDPWDVTAGATTAVSSTDVDVAGTNTTVNETLCLFIACCTLDNNATRFSSHAATGVANFTVFANDHNTNSGNGGGFSMWGGDLASAGDPGNGTATLNANSQQGKLFIALKPPAGGAAATPDTWYYRMTAQGAHFG